MVMIMTINTLKIYHLFKRGLYFRPNAQGYTYEGKEAGVFSFEEAIAYCKQSYPDVTMIPVSTNIELICPFCKTSDFDDVGLKHHLTVGYCDEYNNLL